jgi:hypothetical protein
MTNLSPERIRELARAGAEATLTRLRTEIEAIEQTFPELGSLPDRAAIGRSLRKATQRSRTMSASARKAVSERMKRYWAERRKATTKAKAKATNRAGAATKRE